MKVKKIIAPLVIGLLLILYFVCFIIVCFLIDIPLIVKILCSILPLALAGVSLHVLIQRIDEIRSGEEDDLSKY